MLVHVKVHRYEGNHQKPRIYETLAGYFESWDSATCYCKSIGYTERVRLDFLKPGDRNTHYKLLRTDEAVQIE